MDSIPQGHTPASCRKTRGRRRSGNTHPAADARRGPVPRSSRRKEAPFTGKWIKFESPDVDSYGLLTGCRLRSCSASVEKQGKRAAPLTDRKVSPSIPIEVPHDDGSLFTRELNSRVAQGLRVKAAVPHPEHEDARSGILASPAIVMT